MCRQKDKTLVRDAKVLRKIKKLETNIKKIAINRKHYEEKLRKKGQKNIQKRKEATLSKYKETSGQQRRSRKREVGFKN